MFVRSVMKQECWDNMTIKGKSLKGFARLLVVSNFPMKDRSEQEMEELDYVTRLRKVELADQLASKHDKKDVSERCNCHEIIASNT